MKISVFFLSEGGGLVEKKMEDSPSYTQISFYSVKTHTPLWMLWEDFCPQAKCVDVEIVNYQKF